MLGNGIEGEGISKIEFDDKNYNTLILYEYHELIGDGNGNHANDKTKIYLSILPEYQKLN